MATIDTTNTTATTTSTSSTSSLTGTSASDVQDRFLKLLVAQLKNQDPLNPQDNAQITSQMAQLSTVTGIEKLNSSMSTLSSTLLGNQITQAAALVGHTVLIEGDGMTLANGSGIGAFSLGETASYAQVEIRDSDGNLVKTLAFSNLPAGTSDFIWDGTKTDGTKASDGQYTMSITASNGQSVVDATMLSYAKVNSVQMGTSGTYTLNVLGKSTGISLDAIKEIGGI